MLDLRGRAALPFDATSPGRTIGVYDASDAALDRIANSPAAEFHGTGIRAKAVQPRAAVLSEGAALVGGDTLRPEQIEPLEETMEATTRGAR